MGKGLWTMRKRITRFFSRTGEYRSAIGLRLLAVVAMMVTAAFAAMAQTGGGATLVGTVKDSTGAVVAGAKVRVVNTATNYVSETQTNAEGGYYVPYLVPGTFRMTVDAAGFKGYVREGLTLMAMETPRVDIVLEVGAQTDSVTVSGAAPLLDTENVVSAYVLPSEVLTAGSGRDETRRLPDAVHAWDHRRAKPGGRPHRWARRRIDRRLSGWDHSQVAVHRHREPGGWRGPGQHGRYGRSKGAHHRRFRRIRAHSRRVDEDGV